MTLFKSKRVDMLTKRSTNVDQNLRTSKTSCNLSLSQITASKKLLEWLKGLEKSKNTHFGKYRVSSKPWKWAKSTYLTLLKYLSKSLKWYIFWKVWNLGFPTPCRTSPYDLWLCFYIPFCFPQNTPFWEIWSLLT